MVSFLDKLNKQQREAVAKTEGPILIIAGAGSGKTRTLTIRVAYLVKEKHISPKNILAVTFTNKAAQEMTERIKEHLGLPHSIPSYSQYLPHIGTFHSICVKILRKEIEKIGYKKNFVIYDDQDQLAVMKRSMKELGVSQDQIKPQAVLGAISSAKNKLIDAAEFEKRAGSYFEELVAKCFVRYQNELKAADALDFDDIILLTVKIFRQYPEILSAYQELFRYIMVDEYQDTNHAQYTLLKMLAEKYRNLCVVGDDWQSIYGWRGADVQNILDFEKDYEDAVVVKLEQNYRSTQTILDAAYCVISKNVNRKDKKLWTENKEGHLLTSYEAVDEKDESRFIVEEILALKSEMNLGLSNFAILYRTNAQSRALEEAFLNAGLPYKIIGGVKFYQRKEIKDVLAYLHLVHNPFDKVGFERIINVPARGIGEKTAAKIVEYASQKGASLLEALEEIISGGIKIPDSKRKVLEEFLKLIKKYQIKSETSSVGELIEGIYRDSAYEAMLLKEGEEGMVRHENVQELLTVAKKFEGNENGLASFLEEVALVSQTDEDLGAKDSVPMMTLHSAKGLEFEVIFIVGMEEGILPHSRAALSEREMEEERRLCYVGITRAKQKAYLLFTQMRSIYGTTQVSLKSRFMDEIDVNLFEERYSEKEFCRDDFGGSGFGWGGRFSSGSGKKEKEKVITTDEFRDGQRAKHDQFGEGIVIMQDEETITVAFPKFGIKKLAKGVASLRRV